LYTGTGVQLVGKHASAAKADIADARVAMDKMSMSLDDIVANARAEKKGGAGGKAPKKADKGREAPYAKPKKDAPKKERPKKERKERPEAAPSKSVFVGNLPFTIEAAALEAHMSVVGACTADLKKREKSGKPAGFAIVEYESIEVATEAIEKLTDSELEGRKILVRFDAGK
jgi:RNA recognition motif-containing protein